MDGGINHYRALSKSRLSLALRSLNHMQNVEEILRQMPALTEDALRMAVVNLADRLREARITLMVEHAVTAFDIGDEPY